MTRGVSGIHARANKTSVNAHELSYSRDDVWGENAQMMRNAIVPILAGMMLMSIALNQGTLNTLPHYQN